jgi:glutathione S-transferase
MPPTITAFQWAPPLARGFVLEIRARWAFEEAGEDYTAVADHLAGLSDQPPPEFAFAGQFP